MLYSNNADEICGVYLYLIVHDASGSIRTWPDLTETLPFLSTSDVYCGPRAFSESTEPCEKVSSI